MKRAFLVVVLALAATVPSAAFAGGQTNAPTPSRAQQAAAVHTAENYPPIKRWLMRYPGRIRIQLGFRFPQWDVAFYAASPRDYGYIHRGQLLQVALVQENMTPQVTIAERNPFPPDLGDPPNSDLTSTVGGMVPGWLWAALAVLFISGLMNWSRLRSWRSVDLAVVGAGFLPAFYLYGSHHYEAWVIAVYPPLLYLIVRFGLAVWRPAALARQWLPSTPPFLLAGLGAGLAAARVALMLTRGRLYDIGIFGQVGAHDIVSRHILPYGLLARDIQDRGDVYGPVNYLAYVPTLPFTHGSGPRLAAIVFDLATVAVLALVGKRVSGWAAATALAFAWLANPFTLYVMMQTANDSLVALIIAVALAVAAWPWLRGALIGLAVWTKFAPAALIPLWMAPGREKRQALKVAGGVVAVSVLMSGLFFLGGHPLREARLFYSATISWEFSREAWAPFSVWAYSPVGYFSHAFSPSLAVWRDMLAGVLVVCGLAMIALRRVSLQRLAGGSVMLIAFVQLLAPYWFFNYLVWMLPLVAVALFTGAPDKPAVPARRMKIRELDTASMAKKRAASSAGKRRRKR